MRIPIKKSLIFLTILNSVSLTILAAHSAFAGGFSYAPESNPVNPAGSQGATGLDNATAVFYNPAAIMRLSKDQIVIRQDLAIDNIGFEDNGSTVFPGLPLSGGDANGRSTLLIPSFAASWKISDEVAVGVSVETPFGLATFYPKDWVGRYQAIESRLSTININPAIAARVTKDLSVGVGVNLQYAGVVLSNAVDFGSLIALAGGPAVPQQLDGLAKLEGNDWSWGWNAGILYEPTSNTRIGLAYRSQISHKLRGKASFEVPAEAQALTAGGAFKNSAISANLDLPDILSFGLYQKLGPSVAIAGQVDWQNWSRYSTTRVTFDNPAQPEIVEENNWRDTFRFAFGTIYNPSEQWTLRLGVAYDPSPVKDRFLTPRVPSSDAIHLDFGVTYKPTTNLDFTARYLHVFYADRDINRSVPGAGTLVGTFSTSIDVFSLMLKWSF